MNFIQRHLSVRLWFFNLFRAEPVAPLRIKDIPTDSHHCQAMEFKRRMIDGWERE